MTSTRCPTCHGPAEFRGRECYECRFGERDKVLIRLNQEKVNSNTTTHEAAGDYRQKRVRYGTPGGRRAPDRLVDRGASQ